MQRLDKYLSEAGLGSRSELHRLIRGGEVRVDGRVVTDPAHKLAPQAAVTVRGAAVEARRTLTLLLHKPAGFVSATEDPRERTVMELLPERYRRWGLAPAGRLDKDTEGLLLLTNDGQLAHRLISPRSGVVKVYYAEHEGSCTQEDVLRFREGLTLKDGTRCLPAKLEPLGAGRSRVSVTEGKYHQVRRMLASCGCPVVYLRREREGELALGALERGCWRELTAEEIAAAQTPGELFW